MSRGRRWWTTRPTITATIETGGAPHHVSWRAGRLLLHDHDLAAEEVLLALGGEPCACLLVRDAFRDLHGASSPGPWRQTTLPSRVVPGGALTLVRGPRFSLRGAASGNSALSPRPMPRTSRQVLLSLQNDPNFHKMPPEHRQRLLAQLRHQVVMELVPGPMAELISEIAHLRWRRRNESVLAPQPRAGLDSALERAAQTAVNESVRHARAHMRSYSTVTVACSRLPPGEPARIDGRLDKFGGFINIGLPAAWLNRVWLRGLANADGQLVLSVDAAAPATLLRGRAVRWQSTAPGASIPVIANCLLTRHDRTWHLAWC